MFFGFLDSQAATYYPEGTLIKGDNPEVFVIENGMKRWINSPEVFNELNYDWKKIVRISDDQLGNYPRGKDISKAWRYPDNTLVKGSCPEVYVIENGRKRWIPDPETFNAYGFWWRNIVKIGNKELKKISEGKNLEPKKIRISRPQTFILGNPPEVFQTNKVIFKFSGRVKEEIKPLVFETFLDGYDKRWRRSRKGERGFNLPKEGGFYTLFVRAQNSDGNFDLTPAKHSFGINVSPYYQQIKIRKGDLKTSDLSKERVSIYSRAKEYINLEGWRLESERRGTKYYFPKAYEIPQYYYWTKRSDINLSPRGEVVVFSGRSPSGYSFQLNKCTGYLNNRYDFYPSLPRKCPIYSDRELESIYGLPSWCRKLIRSVSRCQEPNLNKFLTEECRDYARENLNYGGCVKNHRYDSDFFSKKWYVYLNRNSEIWSNYSDTIILRDNNGLIVDKYSY